MSRVKRKRNGAHLRKRALEYAVLIHAPAAAHRAVCEERARWAQAWAQKTLYHPPTP